MNHFKSHLFNQSHKRQTFRFALAPELQAAGMRLTQAVDSHDLEPGAVKEVHLFVSFPRFILGPDGSVPVRIEVSETSSGGRHYVAVTGMGPVTRLGGTKEIE